MHPHLELVSTPEVTSVPNLLSANDGRNLTSGKYQTSPDLDHEKGSIAPTPADPVLSENNGWDCFLSRLIWAGFIFPSLMTLSVNDAM